MLNQLIKKKYTNKVLYIKWEPHKKYFIVSLSYKENMKKG